MNARIKSKHVARSVFIQRHAMLSGTSPATVAMLYDVSACTCRDPDCEGWKLSPKVAMTTIATFSRPAPVATAHLWVWSENDIIVDGGIYEGCADEDCPCGGHFGDVDVPTPAPNRKGQCMLRVAMHGGPYRKAFDELVRRIENEPTLKGVRSMTHYATQFLYATGRIS